MELVQPAAKALSEILDIDYDATLQKLSKRTSNDCLLRRRVDADLADAVRAWCTQNNAQGIQILQDTKRVYPQGNFMGCLLGFTDVDNQGLWGLELQYDAQLTGRNGTILTAKNAWGYDMPTHYSTLQDAVLGNDITLTIPGGYPALSGKRAQRRRGGAPCGGPCGGHCDGGRYRRDPCHVHQAGLRPQRSAHHCG